MVCRFSTPDKPEWPVVAAVGQGGRRSVAPNVRFLDR
jgi:hypothetical protein